MKYFYYQTWSVQHKIRWVSFFAFCLTTLGCGGNGTTRPVPVRGTVEYNGQPLTQGSVVFVPMVAAEGHAARGAISRDGSFALTTFQESDGAFPGDYKVTVFAYDGTRDVSGSSFSAVGPSLIPERYNDASTTDLQCTVNENRTEVKLELKD